VHCVKALKGIAYPVSGALMGALDWRWSAAAMLTAQICSISIMAFWSGGGARQLTLSQLWGSLAVLFTAQVVVGLARIASRTGPWRALRGRK